MKRSYSGEYFQKDRNNIFGFYSLQKKSRSKLLSVSGNNFNIDQLNLLKSKSSV